MKIKDVLILLEKSILKEANYTSYEERQAAIQAKKSEIYKYIDSKMKEAGLDKKAHQTSSLPQGRQYGMGYPVKFKNENGSLDEDGIFQYHNNIVKQVEKLFAGNPYSIQIKSDCKPGYEGSFLILFNAEKLI